MSAYKIVRVVGTSPKGFEDAIQSAVSAAKALRNLRIARVIEMDATLDKKGKVDQYRVKVELSFKYES